MKKRPLIIEKHNLFNHAGVDLAWYYNPSTNTFVVRDSTCRVSSRLVAAPYKESYRRVIWKRFRELLSDEERIIADSYPYRRGYFNYLREEGLIDTYDAAETLSTETIFDLWESENGLRIDWETVNVEY